MLTPERKDKKALIATGFEPSHDCARDGHHFALRESTSPTSMGYSFTSFCYVCGVSGFVVTVDPIPEWLMNMRRELRGKGAYAHAMVEGEDADA